MIWTLIDAPTAHAWHLWRMVSSINLKKYCHVPRAVVKVNILLHLKAFVLMKGQNKHQTAPTIVEANSFVMLLQFLSLILGGASLIRR